MTDDEGNPDDECSYSDAGSLEQVAAVVAAAAQTENPGYSECDE